MPNFVMKPVSTLSTFNDQRYRVLIVTRGPRPGCGFFQLGLHLENILCEQNDGPIRYSHSFVESVKDIFSQLTTNSYDALVINGNDTTLPFARRKNLKSISIPIIKFGGDTTQRLGNDFSRKHYDYWLVEDDNYVIYNPYVFKVFRASYPYVEKEVKQDEVKYDIASFGLALPGKGFNKVLEYAHKLGKKTVLLHMPKSDYLDMDGVIQKDLSNELRKLADELAIDLTITNQLLEKNQLVAHLSTARELFFLYEKDRGQGAQLSGVLEYAFATRKPVYLSGSAMFRHALFYSPITLRIEYRLGDKFKELAEGGNNYQSILESWTKENFRWQFDNSINKIVMHYQDGGKYKALQMLKKEGVTAVRKILEKLKLYHSPLQRYYYDSNVHDHALGWNLDARSITFNRLLNKMSVGEFTREIEFFREVCPDLIAKKNKDALSQYALFLKYLVSKKIQLSELKILCIGSYEDLLTLTLKRLGVFVEEVDPNINFTLEEFISKPTEKDKKYDIIFSISVLEHVEDDIEFLRTCEEKLSIGGVQFHTFDFLESPEFIPSTHFRMYSRKSISLIDTALSRSRMYGAQDYSNARYDFFYNQLHYCFASIFFERIT